MLLILYFLFFHSPFKSNDGPYNDGPYVFEFDDRRAVVSICNGEKQLETVDLNYPKSLNVCNKKIVLWAAQPDEETQLEYSGSFKVAAASDIHGQFDLFKRMLINNKIVDPQGKWQFDTGHFVITGDVFDRGDQVLEALWYLYDLEKQAKAAGGRLHFLLGNHEVMVLNGELRYLHEKYIKTAEILNKPYQDLFLNNSVLGDWIRSRPVLVKVNGMLFVHGGFHPDLQEMNLSLSEINQAFKNNLVKKEVVGKPSKLAKFMQKKHSPIWYRGYFINRRITKVELNRQLKHFDVSHIVVGHTTQEQIRTKYNGRIIAIDAGMKNGRYGEILLWDSGSFLRGTLTGETFPLNNLNIHFTQKKADKG